MRVFGSELCCLGALKFSKAINAFKLRFFLFKKSYFYKVIINKILKVKSLEKDQCADENQHYQKLLRVPGTFLLSLSLT